MDILFCENSDKATVSLTEETVKDLAVQEVIEAATIKEEEQQIIKKILCMLPQNIEDIKYRQEIMSDILENEDLAKSLEKALDQIKVLRNYRNSSGVRRQNEATVFSLLEDMRELAVYVGIVEQISSCLEGAKPELKGLIVLRDELCRIAKDDQFKKAKADIEMLLKELSNVRK